MFLVLELLCCYRERHAHSRAGKSTGGAGQFGAAQVLRRATGGDYSSNCIIGQDKTLAEYCDAIAAAGVLTTEPGTFSYGLGALVLGRVCEVVSARLTHTEEKFSDIMTRLLFRPLKMHSAAFYLPNGDPRAPKIPTLFGGVPRADSSGCDVKPYHKCLPPSPTSLPANTVSTDNAAGPRKCESGDTGTCMTVRDYSRFYEFLLRGGTTEDGVRLLSQQAVHRMTNDRFGGLDRSSVPAHVCKVTGTGDENALLDRPSFFDFGMAVSPKTAKYPHECWWGGYAQNFGRLYPDDDSYLLVFPQFMFTSPGGMMYGNKIIKQPALEKFLSLWK